MDRSLLVLNAGSSSIKFAVYTDTDVYDLTPLWRGKVEAIGSVDARLIAQGHGGGRIERVIKAPIHEEALSALLAWLDDEFAGIPLHAAGHRVVHGGINFSAPVVVTSETLRELQALCPLAPLHQPHNLRGIEALAMLRPQLPQVACFDTAFHRSMPEVAQTFALPRQITAAGVRRYGFHGLSYAYIADTLPEFLGEMADGRVVVAHLGNGASLCAMDRRASIATTMSFSPLDGIPMATRSGALDPGAVLYLQQTMGMDVDEVAQLLNFEAGLLGVSGISGDMRQLLASAEPDAREAVELFVYHVIRAIGSLAAALGGIDALVFTAGIGENAAAIREKVCAGCAWLGIAIDPEANARNGPCISRTGSPVSAWVIPTDEEIMIARHTLRLIAGTCVAGRSNQGEQYEQ